MRPSPLASPALIARIIHAALVLGIAIFWGIAWYVGSAWSVPSAALPDRKVLYVALFVVSAVTFGAAMYTASRVAATRSHLSVDDWWRLHLGRVIAVWALVEAPALFGIAAYLLTRDFRALIAPFAGLLLFVNYRPSRFAER